MRYNGRALSKGGSKLVSQGGGDSFTGRVGEVTEGDSAVFAAQCYGLYGAPPLGALVRAGTPAIYGVVQRVWTEPLDPSRPVLARGQDAESVEEVYREHPQLERLLTTRLAALIVGYSEEDGVVRQGLPPWPPRIHCFVHGCGSEEGARFMERLDFLRLLLNSGSPLAEEVTAACLRRAAGMAADRDGFMRRAGRALAAELAGEAARLSAIMRRVTG